MVIKAVAAAVAATAMVVGTAASMSNQKKQTKQLQKSATFERQKAQLQSARQKMDAIRAGRSAAAQTSQSAENQGVSGSSIGQGGTGSVISQMNSNLSFLDTYGFYSDQSSKHLQSAANYGASASMWSQVAGAGAQVFGAVGGTGAFKGPPPPKAAPLGTVPPGFGSNG